MSSGRETTGQGPHGPLPGPGSRPVDESRKNARRSATDGPHGSLTGSKGEASWADDLDLVQRSLAGDRAAANELVDRMICIPRFLRTFDARAARPLGDHALADLEQEVATRVWRDRERFSGSSRIESWIYGYARRVHQEAMSAERGLNERVTALDDGAFEQVDPSGPVDEAVADQLDAQALLGLIDELPEREREVVLAKLLTDASFTEIARERDEDVNAVKTRYYRTLDRIKGLVEAGLHHREESR